MRRFTMLTICLLALASLMATTAWGQNAHYIKLSPSFDTNTACYNVSLKEAGLGNAGIQSVDYTVSATGTFTAGCVNHGGNSISGQPKSGSGTATQSTVLPVRNGSTNGTVSICPSVFTLPNPGCTGNQDLFITSANYSNVVLNDNLSLDITAGPQSLPNEGGSVFVDID